MHLFLLIIFWDRFPALAPLEETLLGGSETMSRDLPAVVNGILCDGRIALSGISRSMGLLLESDLESIMLLLWQYM